MLIVEHAALGFMVYWMACAMLAGWLTTCDDRRANRFDMKMIFTASMLLPPVGIVSTIGRLTLIVWRRFHDPAIEREDL